MLYSDVVLMTEFNDWFLLLLVQECYDVVLMTEFNDWFLLLLVQECYTVM